MSGMGITGDEYENINSQNAGDDSLIDRRSYFKLTAVAAASAVTVGTATGTATATASGYGAQGYGSGAYGGSGETAPSDVAPTINRLVATESSPPNPHTSLTVDWAISDEDGHLASARIMVLDGDRLIDAKTISISGSAASDSTDFQIKKGAGQYYGIQLTVADSTGKEQSDSVMVSA